MTISVAVAAPQYETYAAALDFKFPSRTYVGLQVQRLVTDVDRTIGVFSLNNSTVPFLASSTPEQLASLTRESYDQWGKIIRELGIKPQ